MATTPFTSFLPEILPHVPGCADIIAVNAVRNACIEFCADSLYWQETQDPITVSATDFPLDFEAPAGAVVAQVLSVTAGDQIIPPISLDTLETRYYGWRNLTSSIAAAYYQPNPDQFALFPAPAGTQTLTLRCAYKPKRTATGIETYVFEDYLEELASGALQRLMATPGQSYSNPELAAYHGGIFNKAKAEATAEANKSFNRAAISVEMRPLA